MSEGSLPMEIQWRPDNSFDTLGFGQGAWRYGGLKITTELNFFLKKLFIFNLKKTRIKGLACNAIWNDSNIFNFHPSPSLNPSSPHQENRFWRSVLETFGGKLDYAVSAHPKMDPEDNHMYFHGPGGFWGYKTMQVLSLPLFLVTLLWFRFCISLGYSIQGLAINIVIFCQQ